MWHSAIPSPPVWGIKTSNLITSNLWLPGHGTIGWAVWADFHAQHEVSTRAERSAQSSPTHTHTNTHAHTHGYQYGYACLLCPLCWAFYSDAEDSLVAVWKVAQTSHLMLSLQNIAHVYVCYFKSTKYKLNIEIVHLKEKTKSQFKILWDKISNFIKQS